MNTINYNLYLYSNLLKLYDAGFNALEYDIQFELLPTLYKTFEDSIYNDPNKGEYECITNYLTNQYKK
jgi:hypothetical protein